MDALTKKKVNAVAVLALFSFALVAAGALAVQNAAATSSTCTVTVTKGGAVVEGASVSLYASTREYYGAWYSQGALIAVNQTDANGQCTFSSIDSTKYYQVDVAYLGTHYQQNFLGAGTAAIQLGSTDWLRGNAVMLIIGGVAIVAILSVLGYIHFTKKAGEVANVKV